MAKDLLHNAVREALIKDGWEITHDPYRMAGYDPDSKAILRWNL